MGYRKILIPLDGSALAEQALKHLARVAEPGASIHLFSAVTLSAASEAALIASSAGQPFQPVATTWPLVPSMDDEEAMNTRKAYLKKIGEWLEQGGYRVTTQAAETE